MNGLFFDDAASMVPVNIRTLRPQDGECGRTAPDMPRFIMVTDGYCQIKTQSHTYHMTMMCLLTLTTQNAYRFSAVSPECSVTVMDVARLRVGNAAVPAKALRAAYPVAQGAFARGESEYFFYDLNTSVLNLFRLLAIYAQYPPERRFLLSGGMLNILLITIASAMDMEARAPQSAHVAAAQRYIRTHYAQRISAADIAAYVGVHVGHLYKLFTAQTGQTPGDYILRIRLRHASELLCFTDIPVKKVAALCGFTTQQYFSRVFCEHMGMSPYAYRHSYDFTCDYQGYKKHLAGRIAL